MVTVTIERFISVWYPFKANIISILRNGAIGSTAVGAILFGENAHYLWSMEDISSNSTTSHICTIVKDEGLQFFNLKAWPWIDAFLASYCPFVIMLIRNTFIILRLIRPRWYKTLTSSTRWRHNVKMTSMTAMHLAVTFTFLVLTIPGSLFIIGQHTWWKDEKPKNPFRFDVF